MSLYKLSIDTEERYRKAAEICNLLKPITEIEINLFDCDNLSNMSSELEDPFNSDDDDNNTNNNNDNFEDDLEENNKSIDSRKKRLSSKMEMDIFLMSTFSKEYLKVEEEFKNEITDYFINENNSNYPAAEILLSTIVNIKLDNNKSSGSTEENIIIDGADDDDEQLINEINKQLNGCGLEKYKAEKEANILLKSSEIKKRSIRNLQQKTVTYESIYNNNNDETDAMSAGIWRMLKGHPNENGFPISEIGYNIFNDKQIDWLVRNELVWDEKEKARKKCLNWMKKSNI